MDVASNEGHMLTFPGMVPFFVANLNQCNPKFQIIEVLSYIKGLVLTSMEFVLWPCSSGTIAPFHQWQWCWAVCWSGSFPSGERAYLWYQTLWPNIRAGNDFLLTPKQVSCSERHSVCLVHEINAKGPQMLGFEGLLNYSWIQKWCDNFIWIVAMVIRVAY